MNSTSFDTVLFDKDGTIIDFSSIWMPWLQEVVEEVCRTVDILDTPSWKKQAFHAVGIENGTRLDPESPLAIGSMQDTYTILAYCLYNLNHTPWSEALYAVMEAVEHINVQKSYTTQMQAIDGVENFILECKAAGKKIGVLTADDQDQAILHLEQLHLNHHFDFVMGSDQVERSKPFPDIAVKAAKAHDFDLSRAIMIGDTDADMGVAKNADMARALGLVTYAYPQTHHLRRADEIYTTYPAMKDALFGGDENNEK
ncbi:HAD family hydrolase [Geomicrobium sp. JCM 19039]|uniref:HAD family hydrolase n=1 Tax=Geomicrobium sp. JCM 19039 TaxID=1460636 RepID=UPI00045F36BA|nr:HAD-IA family hydrolase [Geomicrobium sp. JCM 19039]GAK13664.1 hydrolase [Geomicrobium sp. JCM 19039]